MRHSLRLLCAFALALLLGGMVLGPASAQDDDEGFDFTQLQGLQSAVGRSWYGDYSSMYDSMATPGATPTLPAILGLSLGVFKFDSGDNADASFDTLVSFIKQSAEEGLSMDTGSGTPVAAPSMNESDVSDVGDEAKMLSISSEEDGATFYESALLVRDDDQIILAFSSGGADSSATVTKLADDITGRDAGDGDGTFSEDGTSTGGLWDLFPPADDAGLTGLTVSDDEIIFPVPGTPEAGS